MFTDLFRIEGPWPGRLSVSARPRGGDWLDAEMGAWREAGIDIVVSLLEPEEAISLNLEDEKARSDKAGIRFVSFPIADRSVPASGSDIHGLLSQIDAELSHDRSVAIHCRQGIGRAGLIACALLIERGLNSSDAIRRVSAARRVQVPETEEQRLWLESFAPALAGRR